MRVHLQLLVWLIPILFVAAGCQPIQTIKSKQTMVDLEQTLYSYENVIRWGTLEHAYSFLDPESPDQPDIPDNLSNIRISSYELIKMPVLLDENRATQSVKIYYVLEDRQVEHSVMDNQQWERKEGTKLWYRTNPIPEFK